MNVSMYEDYEIDSEDMMEMPRIQEMHYEMINESIKDQIEDPFTSRTNFVEEYFETINEQMEINGENPEVAYKLNSELESFCNEVIDMIANKFGLDVDVEEMNIIDLKNLTLAMYEFFIIRYPKNIKKFFVKFIINNKDLIKDALSEYSEKSDVVSTSLKNKLANPDMALIISNLRATIDYIIGLNLPLLDVFGVFNPERYDVYVISDAIESMVISEEKHRFFYVLDDSDESEDENFDNVYLSIEYSLLKKYKNESVNDGDSIDD